MLFHNQLNTSQLKKKKRTVGSRKKNSCHLSFTYTPKLQGIVGQEKKPRKGPKVSELKSLKGVSGRQGTLQVPCVPFFELFRDGQYGALFLAVKHC